MFEQGGENMKQNILVTISGFAGGIITALFGGWDSSLTTLLIFMSVDFITGVIVAGVFHNSQKTNSGGLSSKTGWMGVCKKIMIIVFVAIGHRLDLMFGSEYIMSGICIAFMVNELISIIENAGLMGVPIPAVLKKAIDILDSKKEDESK